MIRKAFSRLESTPLGVPTVRQYLPLCCVRTAPEFSEEEGSYASRFVFRKFTNVVFYFSWLCPVWLTLLYSCQFKGSCYDCLWRGDKGSWYRNISSAYHRWPELLHYICFVQSGKAFTVKGNKEITTHTHNKLTCKCN